MRLVASKCHLFIYVSFLIKFMLEQAQKVIYICIIKILANSPLLQNIIPKPTHSFNIIAFIRAYYNYL